MRLKLPTHARARCGRIFPPRLSADLRGWPPRVCAALRASRADHRGCYHAGRQVDRSTGTQIRHHRAHRTLRAPIDCAAVDARVCQRRACAACPRCHATSAVPLVRCVHYARSYVHAPPSGRRRWRSTAGLPSSRSRPSLRPIRPWTRLLASRRSPPPPPSPRPPPPMTPIKVIL